MSDRTTRTHIRQLQELTGEQSRRIERLESLIMELNPGLALGPMDSGVVSPEALAAYEAGEIASPGDYVPVAEPVNNVVVVVTGNTELDYQTALRDKVLEGGEVAEEPEQASEDTNITDVNVQADVTAAMSTVYANTASLYAALHKGAGRWLITNNGEIMERLIGDHPSNGEFDEQGDRPSYFTKDGAAEMVEDLAIEDEVRADQRRTAADEEARRLADEAA